MISNQYVPRMAFMPFRNYKISVEYHIHQSLKITLAIMGLNVTGTMKIGELFVLVVGKKSTVFRSGLNDQRSRMLTNCKIFENFSFVLSGKSFGFFLLDFVVNLEQSV